MAVISGLIPSWKLMRNCHKAKGLIRPFKGLIRPFKALIRPLEGLIFAASIVATAAKFSC